MDISKNSLSPLPRFFQSFLRQPVFRGVFHWFVRKYFIPFPFIFVAFFLLIAGFSSSAAVENQNSSSYSCGEKHFLWKVSKGSSSVWVLGSIHMADSSFYPLPSVIDSAFSASDALVVEMDVTDEDVSAATTNLALQQGVLPKGKSLKEMISEKTWNRLDSLAGEWNIPVSRFAAFRPWMVAMQVSAIAVQKAGILPEWGIDYVLLDRASESGKAILGLETPADQIGVFSEESDSLGSVYLEKTLDEAAKIDSMVFSITRAWKCGDIPRMRSVLNSDSAEAPFEKRLYEDRNKVMAQGIDSLVNAGTRAFVVVGAAHLIMDEKNVLQILTRKGYTVKQF